MQEEARELNRRWNEENRQRNRDLRTAKTPTHEPRRVAKPPVILCASCGCRMKARRKHGHENSCSPACDQRLRNWTAFRTGKSDP